jgi:hypothetical protein
MAAPRIYSYPPDDELVAMIEEHGQAEAARILGIPPNSLAQHKSNRGIKARKKPRPRQNNSPLPDADVSREELLEQQLREAQAGHRRARKLEVFEERAIQALTDAVEARTPTYKPKAHKRTTHDEHEFVLLWSDLHAGEVVSEEETNSINSYDWKTMLNRHERLREGLLSYADNRPYPVRKLHILALGDMLSGDIHDELVETNEMPLAEATVQLGLDGAEWLASLGEHFEEIEMTGVVGNHPRAKRKPQAKRAFDNADWIAYHTMRLALRKHERISFQVPKASAWPVVVAKRWRLLALHGDGIRSTMPGVPWGGVMRRVNALQSQYSQAGQPIDCYCLGHFHSLNLVESNAGRIAMNGSVKGVDEYSLRAFGGGRGPQQLLLTYHPKNGLTDASIIDLEPPKPAGAT